ARRDEWFCSEVVHYLKRTLKRLDVTSRSLIALIEPGSCFAGSLLELALAADRSYQLDAGASDPTVTVSAMNVGPLPMANNLSRLQSRFFGDDAGLAAVIGRQDEPLAAT